MGRSKSKKTGFINFLPILTIILIIFALVVFNFKKIVPVENSDIEKPIQKETEIEPQGERVGSSVYTQKFDNVIPFEDLTSLEASRVEQSPLEYVQVINSCDSYFQGVCLNARSGPGTEYTVLTKLRNNMVLKIEKEIKGEEHTWYKVVFDEWLLYPQRIQGDLYISSEYAQKVLVESGEESKIQKENSKTKKIVIYISEQMLYAYDGEELFMEALVSTGLDKTPTPFGSFTVIRKTPSRYMQGPIPGITNQYYDLPGVPWVLYFTEEGAAIHGTYWHDNFGKKHSNGCVNLDVSESQKLYDWASLGTIVLVVN